MVLSNLHNDDWTILTAAQQEKQISTTTISVISKRCGCKRQAVKEIGSQFDVGELAQSPNLNNSQHLKDELSSRLL